MAERESEGESDICCWCAGQRHADAPGLADMHDGDDSSNADLVSNENLLFGCDGESEGLPCKHWFCKACVVANLGGAEARRIERSDPWRCFVCDPFQIKPIQERCTALLEKRERGRERAKRSEAAAAAAGGTEGANGARGAAKESSPHAADDPEAAGAAAAGAAAIGRPMAHGAVAPLKRPLSEEMPPERRLVLWAEHTAGSGAARRSEESKRMSPPSQWSK